MITFEFKPAMHTVLLHRKDSPEDGTAVLEVDHQDNAALPNPLGLQGHYIMI